MQFASRDRERIQDAERFAIPWLLVLLCACARMGYRVVAIERGSDKEPLAKSLGAHLYLDTDGGDVARELRGLGGADAVLGTAPGGAAMGALIAGLKIRSKLIVVGVSPDPIPVPSVPIIFGGRTLSGSLVGMPPEIEDTLAFGALHDVRPVVQTVTLDQAPEAFDSMMKGKARFRFVIKIQ